MSVPSRVPHRRAFADCVVFWASTGTFTALTVWTIQALRLSGSLRFSFLAVTFGAAAIASGVNLVLAAQALARSVSKEVSSNAAAGLGTTAALTQAFRLSLLSVSAGTLFLAAATSGTSVGLLRSVVAMIIVIAGLSLRAWAIFFRSQATGELLYGGPYRLLRHPRYVGTMLAYLGACVIVWRPIVLLPLTMVAAAHVITAKQEDRQLESRFGASAHRYIQSVGALWPRFPLRDRTAEDKIDWSKVRVDRNAILHVFVGCIVWLLFVGVFWLAAFVRG